MKKLTALLLALCLVLSLASFASADEAGKVYYLNFKPEADEAWQALAKTYTEQTGVEVKVLTAASGTYSDTLTSEMEKKDAAPTLFQIGNAEGVHHQQGAAGEGRLQGRGHQGLRKPEEDCRRYPCPR